MVRRAASAIGVVDRAEHGVEAAAESVSEQAATDYFSEHTGRTLLIAVSAGFVLGLFVSRLRPAV